MPTEHFWRRVVYSIYSARPAVSVVCVAAEATLRKLDRYIFREVGITWLAVTGVLLVILVSFQLSRVLSQAAANNFPREVVLSLIGLTSAGYLTVVVPVGFFLAIVLSLGRLYHESEMAALQSCGIGPAGLFRPIGVLGAIIALFLVWLSFAAIPAASARAVTIRAEALREAQFGQLEPGRFRTFGDGSIVFYAERVDDNGILHNVQVFVDRPDPAPAAPPPAQRPKGSSLGSTDQGVAVRGTSGDSGVRADARRAPPVSPTTAAGTARNAAQDDVLEVWVAARAEQRGAGRAEQTFVLYDGERYEGVPGSAEFRIIKFAEGHFPFRLAEPSTRTSRAEARPTRELLRLDSSADLAELQWRVSVPLMALILMMIAVPLSRLQPRQGRFGKIGIAILVYFLYSQLLSSARAWVEGATVPGFVGLWWVHLLALCAGAWLLWRANPPGRMPSRAPAGARA